MGKQQQIVVKLKEGTANARADIIMKKMLMSLDSEEREMLEDAVLSIIHTMDSKDMADWPDGR